MLSKIQPELMPRLVFHLQLKSLLNTPFLKALSGNTASFYIATGFDLNRYYYKKYDVYQGSSAGLGAGLRQELVGTEAVLAHVPHRVDYSVTSTVG